MKYFKKLRIILLVTISCFGLFAACGSETGEEARFRYLESLLSPASPIEINIKHYYSGKVHTNFKNLIEEFNSSLGAQKGIVVTETAKSDTAELFKSIEESINNVVGADPLPDIIQAYTDTAFAVDEKVGLADMDTYFTEAELDAFVASYLAEGRFGEGGKLKILPVAKSTEVLVLNKKAWEAFVEAEAGDGNILTESALSTMQGLRQVSEKFYDRYGKAFFGRDSFANYMIVGLKQLGYDIFTVDDSGKIAVNENKQAYKTLWDNMYEPMVQGMYICGGGFRSNEMQNETIIAYIGSTASANYIPSEIFEVQGAQVTGQSSYANESIILPLPIFEGGAHVNVQQGAGMSVLKSNEKKEYASAVFLKWFTENERNLKFALDTSYSPVKKEVASFDAISASEFYAGANQNVRHTLEVSCQMLDQYEFYFTKGFQNGTDIRDNLLAAKNLTDTATYKQSMQYKAIFDRKKVEENVLTVSELLTPDNFESWYADVIREIKVMLG